MPIKLPQIERTGLVAPEPEAKVDVRVPTAPGLVEPLAIVGKAVQSAGELYERMQTQREDTLTDDISGKWINDRTEELEGFETRDTEGNVTGFNKGLRHADGDPTELYAQFDDGMEETRERVISEAQLSDRGKILLEKKMNQAYNNIYRKSLLYRGMQQDKYEASVTKAAVKNIKREAKDSLILEGAENAVKQGSSFSRALGKLSRVRIKSALKNRSAKEDSKGDYLFFDEISGETIKVKLNQVTKLAIATDQSDTVTQAVSSLTTLDTVDQADQMLKAYSDYVDPVNEAKLKQAIDKTLIKRQGALEFQKIENLDFDEQERKLKALPANTAREVEIKEDALNRLDLNKRRKNRVRNIRNDQAEAKLYQIVSDRMASSQPYENTYQMQNDPLVSGLWNKLSKASSKKMLNKLVEPEKGSKSETPIRELLKVDKIFIDGGFKGMPANEFHRITANLSRSDFKRYWNKWVDASSEKTFRKYSRDREITARINDVWLANGYTKKFRGRELMSSERDRENFKREFTQSLEYSRMDQNTPPDEMERIINEAATKWMLKNKGGNQKSFFNSLKSVFGSEDKPSESVTPTETSTPRESRVTPQQSSNAKVPGRKRWGQFSSSEQIKIRQGYKQANPKIKNPSARTVLNWYYRTQQ